MRMMMRRRRRRRYSGATLFKDRNYQIDQGKETAR
jgi:hypothetical protein